LGPKKGVPDGSLMVPDVFLVFSWWLLIVPDGFLMVPDGFLVCS
jgi:hypothetical protein